MAKERSIELLTLYVFISKYSSCIISSVKVNWCSTVSVMNRLKDLDSNNQEAVEDIKAELKDQFNSTRESWLMKGMYDYYLVSNSSRVIDVIASVKEPHDTHFFDKSLEGLKSSNKLPHLTLLGYVIRKKPIWLFKISQHSVFHELIRILKTEIDIVTVVSALLIINILLPFIPGVLGKHLPLLFSVFSKLAAMNATREKYHEAQLIHLQISLYTLFHRLYGMFPCNFLFYLHKEYSTNENMLPVFSHTVKPMLDTVRVNPLLITGNSDWEKESERWKNIEPHDIIVSCAKLLMAGNNVCEPSASGYEARSSFDCKNMLGALKVSGKHSVVDYCNELSKKSEELCLWSPSTRHQGLSHHIESTPTMIPLTPITRGFEVSSPYSEHEGSSPPEAAVEATPETTPSRDYADVPRPPLLMRIATRPIDPSSPVGSSRVPISDRSFPNSPIQKDAPQFQVAAPESPINLPKGMEKLLHDRDQMTSGIEFERIGPFSNDLNKLISNQNLSTSSASMAISDVEQSSAVNASRGRRANGLSKDEGGLGTTQENNLMIPDTVDDFEDCELEKSGSPCTAGGLHMPDKSQWQKFAKTMRTRYNSQTYSDSGGFSTGTSPQDINNYLIETKVRRTNSCPEMKKSSPNSIVSFGHSDKLSLPEENEEDEDADDTNGRNFTENHVSKKKTELVCCGTQTEEIQSFHFPYEHLFLDVFPPLHTNSLKEHVTPTAYDNSMNERQSSVYEKMYAPSKLLQKYIDAAVNCHTGKTMASERMVQSQDPKFLANQLKLLSVQMQFEEYRREIHAERNRRLLGRSRRNKTLEEHNSALKDQVLLQQKDLENSVLDLQKLEKLKEAEVQNERRSAEYWKDRYYDLEKEHKIISDRCQEIEAQLKDEKKSNAHNSKLIFEDKAALIDITNELHTSQREAKVAKELRAKVVRLQTEIIKAGEMIIRYHRRLSDLIRPVSDGAQHELLRTAYKEEVERLKNALKTQSISLDATRALIENLRQELVNKENESQKITENFRAAEEERKKDLQELKNSYEELKKSFNRELERAQELTHQLDNAKRVNRLSQVPLRPVAEYINAGRYSSNSSISGYSNVELSIPDPSGSKFLRGSSSDVDESKLMDGTRKNSVESTAHTSGNELVDSMRMVLKKKGRMECAESGQLRSSQSSDADTSSGKNVEKDSRKV